MTAAGERVQALERRRADREVRPVRRRERGQEERHRRVDGRDQARAMLDLLGERTLVDRHLDVYRSAGGDRGAETRLVLLPARALARVARAFEVEADDRHVR